MKAALFFTASALAIASAAPLVQRETITLSYYSDSSCKTLVKTVSLPESVCQALETYNGVIVNEPYQSVTFTQIAAGADCRGSDTKPTAGACFDNSASAYKGAYWGAPA